MSWWAIVGTINTKKSWKKNWGTHEREVQVQVDAIYRTTKDITVSTIAQPTVIDWCLRILSSYFKLFWCDSSFFLFYTLENKLF